MTDGLSRRSFLRNSSVTSTAVMLGAGGALLAACDPVELLAPDALGLALPPFFTSRVVATTGQPVPGTSYVWHTAPDGGACIPLPDGGWSYISNAEWIPGGASFLRFDADANVIDAGSVMGGVSSVINCSGGTTPWGTWLTCEEAPWGRVFECDPLGAGPAIERPGMGNFWHEAAVCDPINEVVYLTEDPFYTNAAADGGVYRFTPDTWGDLSSGLLEILTDVGGVPTWQTVPDTTGNPVACRDQVPATIRFDKAEGCDMVGETLVFTEKSANRVWAYDPTVPSLTIVYNGPGGGGALAGPDGLRVRSDGLIYVAEDGGNMEVVLVRMDGSTFPIVRVEGVAGSEITGIAFDPTGNRMYFSSQRNPGMTFEVSGPFDAFTTPGPLVL